MSKPTGFLHRPKRDRTKQAIHEALTDVQHAVRPHRFSLGDAFSWMVALAAGASVAWRGLQLIPGVSKDKQGVEKANAENERLRRALVTAVPQDAPSSPAAASVTTPERREAPPEKKAPEPAAAPAQTDADSAPCAEGEKSAEGAKITGWLALAKELYARINRDEVFTRAAALAFVGISSLVPLLLILLAALGFFIREPQQAAAYVQRIVANLLPGQQAVQAANDIIQQTHIVQSAQGLIQGRFWAAAFGILSLLWAAISLFVTASGPMNAAWEVKETRSFIQLRLVCLGVFAGAGLLFVLSLLPSSGPDAVRHLHIPWLNLPQHVSWWIDACFLLLSYAIDIAMFVLIYRFLPNAPVTWKSALFGGAITGALWEIFKKGFALYLAHFGNFNKLYGTLGGIILLVTWIYYSCVLLLLGATLCKMYHEHQEESGIVCKTKPS